MHGNTRAALTAMTLCLAAAAAQALTLYDPAPGTRPSAQGWLLVCPTTSCDAEASGGRLVFDTLREGFGAQAGFSRLDQKLDAQAGYRLDFGLRVLEESHGSANRAGFSLIAVGNTPSQALEIGFWEDQVWVYDFDGDAFLKSTSATFDTTGWHDYSLSAQDGSFVLQADGLTLLRGALRDYSRFGLPYSLPNFLFLGDDSSSAGARVALGAVSLSPLAPVPEPASAVMMLIGLALASIAIRAPGARLTAGGRPM